MGDWRLAQALDQLRDQIDAAHPQRSKASDGTIGDSAHAASKSDHNPDANDVVKALDITHDPAHGQNNHDTVRALVASRDTRIAYIIWDGRIISSTVSPWIWREYDGSNPHTKHFHISVVPNPALYDDRRRWSISLPKPKPVKKVRFEIWDGGTEHARSLDVKAGGEEEFERFRTFLARTDSGLLRRLSDEGKVADVKLIRRVVT